MLPNYSSIYKLDHINQAKEKSYTKKIKVYLIFKLNFLRRAWSNETWNDL